MIIINILNVNNGQIYKKILSCDFTTMKNLKYIVIHHKLSVDDKYKNENNNNKYWSILNRDGKIILHRFINEIDFSSINFRFDQINQASTTKYMLLNLS